MTDTYTIRFTSDGETSGKTAITVAPTNVDNSTSIPIHGKYSTPFGEDLWSSILHVMENFCSTTGPSPAKVTMGQLWFDSATQTLKIWRVLSVAPYTIGWAPVNSFDSSGTLSVALKTSVVDNGILDDSATYDGYFVTKGYSDAHYLPKGNYVSGTTALSKAKIKYSTEVTFDTGDTTALVTKKYVDDKIGVVGSLSITVDADGKMTATKAFLGSPDNFILNDTPAFNDYFVTRDYADDRYFLVGTFDNSVRRQSRSKIKYSSDVVYATNSDDDYTLVHKKYVADAITAAASSSSIAVPPGGLVLSDGTELTNFAFTTDNSGKFLSVTPAGALSWADSGLPSWLSGTINKGVLVSDGSTISSIIGNGGKVLKTIDTSGVLSIGWGDAAMPSWFPQNVPVKGVLVSDGTNVSSSIGLAETVLSVDASNTLQWIAKSSLGGGGGSSGPTVAKLSTYSASFTVPATQNTEPTSPNQTITLNIPSNTTAIDYEIRFGAVMTTTASSDSNSLNRFVVKANGTKVYEVANNGINGIAVSTLKPADDVHSFKYSALANTTSTLTVEVYSWTRATTTGAFGNGFDVKQWIIADPLSATVAIVGGSSVAAPAAGVVTSDGTALNGTSYGTNNYLLASTGTGLKWVNPSTLGGGSSSMINANAIAVHDPGTKTLPATLTTEKNGSQTLLHDGSNSSYASLSAPTQLISLLIPAVTVDTMVSITVGFKTNFTGSAPICVHYVYFDINGTSIRRVGPGTFMTTLRAGSSYTMNLSGQYTCALGGISTAVATVSDMFIEVLAVGGTLTGISSGASSGVASAVGMIKNTVDSKAVSTTLSNLVSITIPASPAGTTVDYWVTSGIGAVTYSTTGLGDVAVTVKAGTTTINEANLTITACRSGWTGANIVTVSSSAVTITLAAVCTGSFSGTCKYNYINATAISGSLPSGVGQAVPTAGIVTSNGTDLSSTTGTADQLLAINSTNTGYTWIDKSTLGGGSFTVPTAGIVTSNGTTLTGASYGTNSYLLASTGTGLTWVNPATLGGSGGSGGASSRTTIQGTATIAAGATANLTLVGFKGYALYKVGTTVGGAWVRIYSSKAARTADASRLQTVDPSTSGVIAEVITTSNNPVVITPGVIGFNDETTPTTDIELAVTNTNATSGAFTVSLTLVKLES